METLGAVIVETSRYITNFLFSRIATLVNFHGNIKVLQNDLGELTSRKNEVMGDVELAVAEGKLPKAQVNRWLQEVEEIEREVQPLLEGGLNNGTADYNCSLDCNMCYRYKLSKSAKKKRNKVKQLLESCNFPSVAADRKSPIKAVEKMLAPSLVGQKAAEETLERLMQFLKNDGIKRIAVWGMGGVGKTTLVKNLNNKLECSSLAELFGMVIWVTVSKDLDLKRVQSQIAERLNLELEAGESMHGRATKLLKRFLMQKKFLLILDDVWEKIDLDLVGIPQDDDQANCKILLTTRSLDVCREMMTNVEIKMDVLNEQAAWTLFAQNAGNVVELEGVNSMARAIARECCGLPLAIKTTGKSMRNKTMIELWDNALCQLRRSVPHFRSIEKDVYLPLKLSYISLPSKILKWCFLYCSLYPESFSIKTCELIQCWIADGLIDKHQTLEEAFNNGIALVENLKDACMLEQGQSIGTVKMHDVLRDVAIWISSIEEGSGFYSQSATSLFEIPEKLQKSFRRVSFMNNMITRLPARMLGCSELTVLFLQGNPIKKIPDGFFRELRALRVLNLSCTLITSLPPSLLQLGELRALLLRNCCSLEKLPPLGAVCKLQVLDLFGTRLRELPKEMGKLSNLRELNLSRTHHLESIEPGTLSGLTSLEALYMSFSAYKWNVKRNLEEQIAAFDELLSLERLSVLHIRLDTVDCLALDSAWLKRLRKFNIRISPRSCDSNCLPTQHDEKRVILRGVDLFERGLEELMGNASALDLVACGGIRGLSDIVAKSSLSSLQCLKSLTITSCDWIKYLLSGENTRRSTLPNLEHLALSRLRNLGTLLEGMVPKGVCFGRLKTIVVVDCPRLKNLICYALLWQLQNLEEIRVSNCRRMKCIIAGKVPNEVLPKLKVIEMRELPNLRTICSRTAAWPALERIEVSNCPALTRLPLSACSAITIRGNMKWWNNLKWVDDNVKHNLQQRFQACADSPSLTKEDRWVLENQSTQKLKLLGDGPTMNIKL